MITPAPGYLLVQPSDADTQQQEHHRPSGLVVAHTTTARHHAPERGVVLAISERAEERLEGLKVGDAVLYHCSGHTFSLVEDAGEVFLMWFEQIVGWES